MNSVFDSFTSRFQSLRVLHAVGSRESNGSRFSLAKSMSSAYSYSMDIPRFETGGFSHGVLSRTAHNAAAT